MRDVTDSTSIIYIDDVGIVISLTIPNANKCFVLLAMLATCHAGVTGVTEWLGCHNYVIFHYYRPFATEKNKKQKTVNFCMLAPTFIK